jgi:hypothetical protein
LTKTYLIPLLYVNTPNKYFFSVIYTQSPNDVWTPPFGQFLGGMTDELEKDYGVGAYANCFVSSGPKTYSLMVRNGRTETASELKAKGFSKTVSFNDVVSHEKLLQLVRMFIENRENVEKLPVSYCNIRRNAQHQMYTLVNTKTFKVTFDKRVILADGSTLPRGY